MTRSNRTLARELVLQGLYALETGNSTPDEIFGSIIEKGELKEGPLQFARGLFELVNSNFHETDAIISSLATNWKLERIALIDKLILRMAIIELKEMIDVPPKVVINEAIELAKKFSTDKSSGFINGILDQHLDNVSSESNT